MVKDILQIGAPILNKKTKEVTDLRSAQTKKVVQDLLDTLYKNEKNSAGLSAPQIGYEERICVCRRVDVEDNGDNPGKDELWEVMINPHVIHKSDELSTKWEGCLSIGKGATQLFGPVDRPRSVTVEYIDREGDKKKLTGNDFFSHVIQHEVDHLEGILFLNYVTNPSNIWTSKNLDVYLAQNEEFPAIVSN